MQTLNVIGAGNVGTTLVILLSRAGLVDIKGVVNQSLTSAEKAVSVIGSGQAVDSISDLPAADIYLIGTSDDAISHAANELAATTSLEGAIVFHCSGSLPSSVLSAVRDKGGYIAGVHPVKSFANVDSSVDTFAGTFCGTEGDPQALAVLHPAFTAIGARILPVDSENKTLYHAAIVFSMNYFIALVEVGLQCYEKAGVNRDDALALLQPILTGAAANVTRLGPTKALTGPIARGDVGTVSRQLDALGEWDVELQTLYAALGRQALALSEQAGNASPDNIKQLESLLRR